VDGQYRGLVKKKQTLDVDSIIELAALEERIYRHRCVEGWSIVVPWPAYTTAWTLGNIIRILQK
jgi:sulfoxide reductase catalytic subunit YedY